MIRVADLVRGELPVSAADDVVFAVVNQQILRVDGGASVNRFLMQFQADVLRCPIDRPVMVETTALGAAFLAGLHAGVWSNVGDIVRIRESAHIFRPKMDAENAQELCRRWHKAVERAKDWE